MSENQFEWRQAWTAARAKHKADAPRNAAIRAACQATRPLKGQPAEQIRTALLWEASTRGVEDIAPRQLDLLVEAVMTSPTHTGYRAMGRGVKALWRTVAEFKAHAVPAW